MKESGHGRGTPRWGTGRSDWATFSYFDFEFFLLFLSCHTFLLSPFQQSQTTSCRFNYMILIHLCCFSSVVMAMAVTTNFLSKSSNFNIDQKSDKCILQCQLISIRHSIHPILQTLLSTVLESRKHNCPIFDPVASPNIVKVKATCFSFGMSSSHPYYYPIRLCIK